MLPLRTRLTGIDCFLLWRWPLTTCIAALVFAFLLMLPGCSTPAQGPPMPSGAQLPPLTAEQKREPIPFPSFPKPRQASTTNEK